MGLITYLFAYHFKEVRQFNSLSRTDLFKSLYGYGVILFFYFFNPPYCFLVDVISNGERSIGHVLDPILINI